MARRRYSKRPIYDLSAMVVGYECPDKGISITECEKREADSIIVPHHYSHKVTKNSCLSLFHRYLREAHPEVKHLISYADTSAGNKGTIYKAASYKLIDEREADFYIMPDGERVHPVTMWHRHGTRAWDFLQAHYPGIRKAEGKQLKFIFNL